MFDVCVWLYAPEVVSFSATGAAFTPTVVLTVLVETVSLDTPLLNVVDAEFGKTVPAAALVTKTLNETVREIPGSRTPATPPAPEG